MALTGSAPPEEQNKAKSNEREERYQVSVFRKEGKQTTTS
jgi:hypothetical protein